MWGSLTGQTMVAVKKPTQGGGGGDGEGSALYSLTSGSQLKGIMSSFAASLGLQGTYTLDPAYEEKRKDVGVVWTSAGNLKGVMFGPMALGSVSSIEPPVDFLVTDVPDFNGEPLQGGLISTGAGWPSLPLNAVSTAVFTSPVAVETVDLFTVSSGTFVSSSFDFSVPTSLGVY